MMDNQTTFLEDRISSSILDCQRIVEWGEMITVGDGYCGTSTKYDALDGNTVESGKPSDNKLIRLSLVEVQSIDDPKGLESMRFLDEICPRKKTIHIDEDDSTVSVSLSSGESTDKIIHAKVFCDSMMISLNEMMIGHGYGMIDKKQCKSSEFAKENWAIKHGC